ncbi:MAG: heat-inducible transcriptional repressor HrcA [Clostridia bacterium]|nr:heat-inducible transcriptional repressor HrcA [Clostridia bacterium]
MSGHELSERKKLILKTVIEAHIATGEPVGSKYLTENAQISCSSATIRNEMAELEALGYLEQPHTSSGRIPSDMGYRFYVDSLEDSYAEAVSEADGINELMKIKLGEIDKILDSASKLASSLTNYTGIAIKPRPSSAHISRFETMLIDPHNFIIVMLTSQGGVKSKSIRCKEELTRESAEHITDCLNACFAGLSADKITLPIVVKLENMLGEYSSLSQTVIKSIYDVMNDMSGGSLRYSGIDHLLQYPEYSDMSRFKELLGALERQDDILDMIEGGEKEDINVYIGSESPVKVMNNSSIVFKTIKKDGKTIGAVGVIGPTRMDYAKVLSTISSISGNISNLLGGEDIKPKRQDNLLTEGDNNG